MPSLTLYDLQQQILNYFQGMVKDSTLSTQTIEELGIYKSLVISSMEDFIEKVFPATHKILELKFREVIKDYLENCPSRSPIFYRLAEDFPNFLDSEFFKKKYDPPNYLAELAMCEWTEVEINNSANLEPKSRLNPVHKVLRLRFPITKLRHLILESAEEEIEELKSSDIDEEEELLMIFRDDESCKTRFFALSDASIEVIQGFELGLNEDAIYSKLLEVYCLEDSEKTKEEFANLLFELKKNHILLE